MTAFWNHEYFGKHGLRVMKITVITVCYNSKNTIENAIKSVIEQCYEELEYIVIDGGSIDGTIERINKYSQYITYFQSEPDKGIYDAMNKGLCHATGDVVAFLNSDDTYMPDALSRAAGYFETDAIDVLAGEVRYMCNGYVLPQIVQDVDPEELHYRMIYCHQGMFVKREVFDILGGFNTDYGLASDYELSLRAHNLGFRFKKVDDVFANFNVDGTSQARYYQCTREIREIALQNIGGHKEGLLEQINTRVDLDDAYRQNVINLVCKKDAYYIKSLFGEYHRILIWGTGRVGADFLRLLLCSGIVIAGFIDSYHHTTQKWGFPVFSPECLGCGAFVCIGTLDYEDEIIQGLRDRNYSEQQYMTYPCFIKKILKYGSGKYADYILKDVN